MDRINGFPVFSEGEGGRTLREIEHEERRKVVPPGLEHDTLSWLEDSDFFAPREPRRFPAGIIVVIALVLSAFAIAVSFYPEGG